MTRLVKDIEEKARAEERERIAHHFETMAAVHDYWLPEEIADAIRHIYDKGDGGKPVVSVALDEA